MLAPPLVEGTEHLHPEPDIVAVLDGDLAAQNCPIQDDPEIEIVSNAE
jgi:hypothetical protein